MPALSAHTDQGNKVASRDMCIHITTKVIKIIYTPHIHLFTGYGVDWVKRSVICEKDESWVSKSKGEIEWH